MTQTGITAAPIVYRAPDSVYVLSGPAISFTDLHAAPVFRVFRLAPEGQRLLGRHHRLAAWWRLMGVRPSFARTQAPSRHIAAGV